MPGLVLCRSRLLPMPVIAQKMKFLIKDFFSKCDQIRRKLRIWSHLLKKSLMKNIIFCAVCISWLKSLNMNCFFSIIWFQGKNNQEKRKKEPVNRNVVIREKGDPNFYDRDSFRNNETMTRNVAYNAEHALLMQR